jgi:hypothetical protein
MCRYSTAVVNIGAVGKRRGGASRVIDVGGNCREGRRRCR